jgi:hypothetical protein
VVTPRLDKPARPARGRSHSLAPAHIGEAGSAALLAIAILGVATFIAAIAMLATGVGIAGRYDSTSPPPNLADLGRGQVLGGMALIVVGGLLVGSAAAVLADLPGSRRAAGILSLAVAGLAAGGVLLAAARSPTDPLLPVALAVATLILGVAGIILVRPHEAA